METEFDGYSLSGVFICVCGVKVATIGITGVQLCVCDDCGRRYMIHRPVIHLIDRERKPDEQ